MKKKLLLATLIPFSAIAVSDLVIAVALVTDKGNYLTFLQLLSHFFFQSIGFLGFLGFSWVLSKIKSGNLKTNYKQRLIRTSTIFLIAVFYFTLIFTPFFTGHRFIPLLKAVTIIASIFLGLIYVLKPSFFVFSNRIIWFAVIFLSLVITIFGIMFGLSIIAPTPKYLREPISAVILMLLGFQWLIFCFMELPISISNKRLFTFGTIGLAVFLTVSPMSVFMSEQSINKVTTYLEGTRTLRNYNRTIFYYLKLHNLPLISKFVGTEFTPKQSKIKRIDNIKCSKKRSTPVKSVLLISVDALRADLFGIPIEDLPNINKLRQQSLEFTSAYQATSGTAGSMTAIHTGRYQAATSPTENFWEHIAENFSMNMDIDVQTFEMSLSKFTDTIIKKLQSAESNNEDFLFHFHTVALHLPHGMARHSHDYKKALKMQDFELGRILDYMDTSGLSETTMLIFTADHGEEKLEERGYVSHGYGVTQTLLHTPLYVRIPTVLPQIRTGLVSSVDIVPTITDALQISCDYSVHGKSLLNKTSTANRVVYGSSMAPHRSLEGGILMYSDNHTVIRSPWKYDVNRSENSRALYNIQNDPLEKNNLIDKEIQIAEEFEEIQKKHLRGQLEEYSLKKQKLFNFQKNK